ncbi:MAG: DUF402 domain-containing protein [Beduini sp.]|uniref:DUF402 domain-containing protein n=1 Tax=Beduini sp. TaxID=1922300 RepID=UPI0039A229E4
MNKPKLGDEVLIHSYKHDGKIHRSWSKGLVLDANEDHTIVINVKTLVTEADGRVWCTREPAICYFPNHEWYNVICMIRNNGVYFYCNLASPSLWDGEAIKYIDYDLDLKVFPDCKYKVLDEEEYRQHQRKMHYPDELDIILRSQLEELIEMAKTSIGPFKHGFSEHWYHVYQEFKRKEK